MHVNALSADSSFEVAEDASKSQIRTAFKKSLGAKKTNKKILSSFIERIA
jgi:ribosomal protein L23